MEKDNVTNVHNNNSGKSASRMKIIAPMMLIATFLMIAGAMLFIMPAEDNEERTMGSVGDTFIDEPFKYTVTADSGADKRVAVTGYTTGFDAYLTSNGGRLTFPDDATNTISGVTYDVTSVAALAFKDHTGIISIDFNKVTSIGNIAFQYCTSLEEITWGSMMNFGSYPFTGCTSLVTIDLTGFKNPALDSYAFYGCKGVEEIIWGDVTTLGYGSFYNCSALEVLDLTGFKGTSVGDGTFAYASSLKEIKWGYVEKMGKSAFASSGLEVLDLTGFNGTEIPEDGFRGCEELKEIIWGPVTSIGRNAFASSGIETLDFTGYQGTSTGEFAFFNCKKINEINFGPVTAISEYSFREAGVKQIAWGSVKEIGNGAFDLCLSLESVDLTEQETVTIGNWAFDSCKSLKEAKLGPLTYMGWWAFRDCSGLEFVDISQYDDVIREETFAYCKKLDEIKIGPVTGIDDRAFLSCESLVTLDLSLASGDIGVWAFCYCYALKYVYIPNTIGDVNYYQFYGSDVDIMTVPERFNGSEFYATSVDQYIRYVGMQNLIAERDEDSPNKIVMSTMSDVKGMINIDHYTGKPVEITGSDSSWTFEQTRAVGSYLVTAAYALTIEVIGGDSDCCVEYTFGGSPPALLNGPTGMHVFIAPYGMSIMIKAEAGEEYELSWEVADGINVIDDVCLLNIQDNENVIIIFSSDAEEPTGVPSATIIPSEGIMNVVPGSMLEGTGLNEGVYFFIFTFMIDTGYDVETHLVKLEEGHDGTVAFAGMSGGVYTYTVSDITTDITIFITVEEEEDDDGDDVPTEQIPSATIIPSEGVINVVPGAMLEGTGANAGVYFFIFTFMIDVGYDVDTHIVKLDEGNIGTIAFAGMAGGVYTYTVSGITTDITIFITVEEEEEDDGTGGGIGGGEGPGDVDPVEENIGDEEGRHWCWKCTLALIALFTFLGIVLSWALFPAKRKKKKGE